MSEQLVTLSRKDFVSDQEVRWCPGCGDYAILAAVQKVMPEFQVPREKTVFVSGIGCSSRFPYYMNTYGFHTIHGRAPAVATGIKLANPELDVWVATGDGDGLSIGGNHLMHALRRNVDLKILLFNNRIYGLTKGQYSPTSVLGQKTKSTPFGVVDHPMSPVAFALGANARFVARTIDVLTTKHMPDMLRRTHDHKGASFLEIFQNCNVFNDGAFDYFVEKDVAADRQLFLEHGKPMVFGAKRDKGLRLKPGKLELEVVQLGDNGVTEADVLVHDETNLPLAFLLGQLEPPEFPIALGVLYCNPAPTYERMVHDQVNATREKLGAGDLDKLFRAGNTWKVG
ncbi:MAG: 2-oxoacid:ferredoxin oxidoreductase subunit beta [Deltaproteobacteria bacterium]|nr:2-oxoacid:ferredoxin oxidoreductase subunit beta [Deltaproteobacteria bacterium]